MGLCIWGDIFQANVNELLGDIEGLYTYIDDILLTTKGSFEEHLKQLRTCFQRFRNAGLKVNAGKCSFRSKKIPYLGYIITREGVKPDPKKIQGIVDLQRPKTTTEVKALIGMVQYYQDMLKSRFHILAPFTAVSSGKKGSNIKWTKELKEAFHKVKKMVQTETLLTYPDWMIPFTIHTDTSDYQLGTVISQTISQSPSSVENCQRLNATVQTEKDLLAIVECLKQFRGNLLGYPIDVWSNHKNLVYIATLSDLNGLCNGASYSKVWAQYPAYSWS